MPEPPTPARTEAHRERAEGARLDNFAGADRMEMIGLRIRVVLWGYVAAVGLLSMLMALTLPANTGIVDGLPGFAYFLLAFIGPILHFCRRRLHRGLSS